MPELIPAAPGSPHVERRIRLDDNRTYCSCGRPWPCPIPRMIELGIFDEVPDA